MQITQVLFFLRSLCYSFVQSEFRQIFKSFPKFCLLILQLSLLGVILRGNLNQSSLLPIFLLLSEFREKLIIILSNRWLHFFSIPWCITQDPVLIRSIFCAFNHFSYMRYRTQILGLIQPWPHGNASHSPENNFPQWDHS